MSRRSVALVLFAAACVLLSACGEPAANNAANKPANAANNAAAAPVNTAAIEADIKKALNDMATSLVKGDAAAIEKLYTDNYRFVAPDGSVATGQERIASMKSGDTKFESLSLDDVTVRVNAEGNGAVSISRATVKGSNLGKKADGQNRVTHVWSKTKDGWRLASAQVTVITAPAAPPSNTANAPASDKANANK